MQAVDSEDEELDAFEELGVVVVGREDDVDSDSDVGGEFPAPDEGVGDDDVAAAVRVVQDDAEPEPEPEPEPEEHVAHAHAAAAAAVDDAYNRLANERDDSTDEQTTAKDTSEPEAESAEEEELAYTLDADDELQTDGARKTLDDHVQQ